MASSPYIDEPSSGIATQGSSRAEAARPAIQSLGKVFVQLCCAVLASSLRTTRHGCGRHVLGAHQWLTVCATWAPSFQSCRAGGRGRARRAAAELVKAASRASAQAACDALDAACRKLSTELRQLEASGCSPQQGAQCRCVGAMWRSAGPPPPKGERKSRRGERWIWRR